MRQKSQQKHFLVFLQTPKGGVKDVNVKASNDQVAGRRAMSRQPNNGAGYKILKVEQGI